MARPVKDPRWLHFSAALIELGFNRRLLTDDREYENHGGPSLWALFLEGDRLGSGAESRLKKLARQERRARAVRANRRAGGHCPDCGNERDGVWARCAKCRAGHRARVRNYRDRLKGLA